MPTLEAGQKAAELIERLPIAGVAVLALFALALVFRLYIRDAAEHRATLAALTASHAAELKAVNEARLRLAAEFEGTIRELLMAARNKRRARTVSRTDIPAAVERK